MGLTATARSIPGTLRQEVVVDGRHRLYTDEPVHLGGSDTGPAPHELFPAALAACVSTTLVRYAQTKEWDLGQVTVNVDYDHRSVPRLFVVHVAVTGDLSEEQLQRLEKVAAASVPGVFMYHCGAAPAFMHIANGMYGAIVVEPRNMPHADRQYVLVSSEWYLNAPGDKAPASLDLTKAEQTTPDWVTWNGYAHQYKEHPLVANPGETVRFWIVDAGPSLNTEFHVVGTVLIRAWLNADLVDAPQHAMQTAVVPAGGGGVFDVRIPKPGIYPFVSHAFASVALGEVGLLNVGNVHGTMSH